MFVSALDHVLDVINTLDDTIDLNSVMTTTEIIEHIHELTNIDKNVELSFEKKQDICVELKQLFEILENSIKF